MVVTLQLALAASPAKRLSDVYGGTAGVPDETKNIPYRQLVITPAGAVGGDRRRLGGHAGDRLLDRDRRAARPRAVRRPGR